MVWPCSYWLEKSDFMDFLGSLSIIYLFFFSLYHVITGIVSVFFSDFALKFYKKIYGFQPKETVQLKMTFKPWGNFALITGFIGFIVLSDLDKYLMILFPFALLLIIRIGYRVLLREELYKNLKINKYQNWRMVIIQLTGAILFVSFAIRGL